MATRVTADARWARCAIYTRQSVTRFGDDPALGSCAVQRERCVEFIRDKGWRIVDEHFDDEGLSGSTVERPALERLLARIEDGDLHRVVVYRLDRFTRRLSDWVRLMAHLGRFNVGLTVVHGSINAGSSSFEDFQLNMLAVFAEWERELIRDRIADARAAKRARGERSAGRVPYGYGVELRTKQLIVIEEQAVVVRWFFGEAARDVPTSELVTKANSLKFLGKSGTASKWTSRAVLRMLRNETYAGRRPDGAPAMHTPIVPDDVFELVQTAIAARRTRKPGPRSKFDERFDPFILRGLLACGACGRIMTTSMSKALTARTAKRAPRYYRCRTPNCRGGQVVATEAERLVRGALEDPIEHWPDNVKVRLREHAAIWEHLWPLNQRRLLDELFTSMSWHAKPECIDVTLKVDALSTQRSEHD